MAGFIAIELKNSGLAVLAINFSNIDSTSLDRVNHCCAQRFIQGQILLTKIGCGVFQHNHCRL
jgi:hypothetical protein